MSDVDREELKKALALVATPKAMVVRLWDGSKFARSAVKVVCVDSERLDTLKFSDAWVGERRRWRSEVYFFTTETGEEVGCSLHCG